MAEDMYKYGLTESNEFPSPSDYFMSFFQNILANLVNINYIYQEIVSDETKHQNSTDLFFNIGRILNIILIVKPMDTAPFTRTEAPISLTPRL